MLEFGTLPVKESGLTYRIPYMSSDIENLGIEKHLQGIKIPPQPQIMVDLQMEQYRSEPDLGEIAKLISQDVGLSGAMLKIVNSRSYGLNEPLASIKDAVMLIGMEKAIAIINGLSIRVEMSDQSIAFMNRFWDSAMDAAMVANKLSRHLSLSSPENAYTLGLFHNCGIPLLFKRFDDYEETVRKAYASEAGRLVDVENRIYKTNHAVAGYYTAKSWRVPEVICAVIAEHHNTLEQVSEQNITSSEKVDLFCLLKMAEHIGCCYKIIGQQECDHEWARLEKPILEYLGISQYDFLSLKDRCAEDGLGGENYNDLG